VIERIQRSQLCLDATIDDYPIGWRERGKCRLQVERAGNKGYRTVRTTTNKFGRWCAPKKSTSSGAVEVVVRHRDDEHKHVWLSCGDPRFAYCGAHMCVTYANGAGLALAKCWRSGPPRREREVQNVKWTTSTLGITAGGLLPENRTEETKEYVYEADSPEEIAAWDLWVGELKRVCLMLEKVWSTRIVQS
jgi:hypothetical protein